MKRYLLLAIFLVLGLAFSQSSVTYINGCTTIDYPGEYKLPFDITTDSNASSYYCIQIKSSDVVFDCDNYKISNDGNFKGYAITISNGTDELVNNVTVRNCKFDKLGGVKVGEVNLGSTTASNIKVLNSEFTKSSYSSGSIEGVEVGNAFNVEIKDNTFIDASVYATYADTVYIEYNSFTNGLDKRRAVGASDSESISIAKNIIDQNSGANTVYLSGSKYSEIVDNTITTSYSDYSIKVSSSEDITISGNKITDDGFAAGISIDSRSSPSKRITIEDNTIEGAKYGLEISGDNLIIRNNIVSAGMNAVIWGYYETYYNTKYGVYNSQIYNNKFVSNAYWLGYGHDSFESNPGTGNSFYISKDCSSPNIIGGSCKGGNYYEDPNNAYLRKLSDTDGDGIADEPPNPSKGYVAVDWPGGEDKLPLTNKKVTCRTINSPGQYIFMEDLSGENPEEPSTCLYINSSNVEVLCDGTRIVYASDNPYYDTSAILAGGNNGYIENVTIKYCKIINDAGDYRSGVKIFNGRDITIEDATIERFSSYGIQVTNSSSNYLPQRINIKGVTFKNPIATDITKGRCVEIDEASEVLVSGITCNEAYFGINVYSPTELTIENSKFLALKGPGIYINKGEVVNIINNEISETTTGSSDYGIMLDYSVGDITVRGNKIYDFDYGMVLDGEGIEVYSNNVSSNTALVLGTTSTTQFNTIADNYLVGYNRVVEITPSLVGENSWNLNKDCSSPNIIGGPCKGGNFYSDYTGQDNNNDGFGDTPYEINPQNIDSLPLVPYNGSSNVTNQTNNQTSNNTANQTNNQTSNNTANQTNNQTTNQTNNQSVPSTGLYLTYSFNCPEYLTVYTYENGSLTQDIYVEIRDSYYYSLITSGLSDSNGKIEFNIIPPIDLTLYGEDQINNLNYSKNISLASCASQNTTNQNNQTSNNTANQTNNQTTQGNQTNNQGSNQTTKANQSSTSSNTTQTNPQNNQSNQKTTQQKQKASYSSTGTSNGKQKLKVSVAGSPVKNQKVEVIYEDGTREVLTTDDNGIISASSSKKVKDVFVLKEQPEEPKKEAKEPNYLLIAAMLIFLILLVLYYLKKRGKLDNLLKKLKSK